MHCSENFERKHCFYFGMFKSYLQMLLLNLIMSLWAKKSLCCAGLCAGLQPLEFSLPLYLLYTFPPNSVSHYSDVYRFLAATGPLEVPETLLAVPRGQKVHHSAPGSMQRLPHKGNILETHKCYSHYPGLRPRHDCT